MHCGIVNFFLWNNYCERLYESIQSLSEFRGIPGFHGIGYEPADTRGKRINVRLIGSTEVDRPDEWSWRKPLTRNSRQPC